MPTYDYQCKECGHKFEEFQSISADLLMVCPQCARPSLRRVMTGGLGMIFKGSGFYLTDYKKSQGDGKTSTPAKETTETKKDSTPAKESKPE